MAEKSHCLATAAILDEEDPLYLAKAEIVYGFRRQVAAEEEKKYARNRNPHR